MDILEELTGSLTEKEQKLFRKYLQHKSLKNNRKDILIFNDLVRNEETSTEEMVTAHYGEFNKKNVRAYHFMRSHLKEQLENFIIQQTIEKNNQLHIFRLTILAQQLYLHKKYQPAWHYLQIAERISKEAEEYEFLNQVYKLMIEYAWTQTYNHLQTIIKKMSENQEAVQVSRSMDFALSTIQNDLRRNYSSGKKQNIEKIIRTTLEKFNVNEEIKKNATQSYKLAILVKMILEEKKDYETLYRYVIDSLKEMQDAEVFNKYNYKYKIELQNIVCFAAARARNYVMAEKYIKIIEEENKLYPESDLLSIQSFMTKAVCLGTNGHTEEAIEVLEYLKVKYKKLYQYDHYFFTTLNCNLTTAYLYLGNTEVPRKCLNELLNNSKRIVRYFGLELLFYCHAIESMVAIEDDDLDYAAARVKSMERKFKKFLQQSQHKRNNAFLNLLRYIVNSRDPWHQKDFIKKVWNFIAIQPQYQLSPEFVSFNIWLYSKIKKTSITEDKYNKVIEKELAIALGN